jgi:hypothetical protein
MMKQQKAGDPIEIETNENNMNNNYTPANHQ